jgi:hypothetical protein
MHRKPNPIRGFGFSVDASNRNDTETVFGFCKFGQLPKVSAKIPATDTVAPIKPYNTMPLPNLKRQCRATCRATGDQCCNPAAYGMATCRSHGARQQGTVRRGKEHPQFKHGGYTQEAKTAYRQANTRLRNLEELGFNVGFMSGPRMRGRKPRLP